MKLFVVLVAGFSVVGCGGDDGVVATLDAAADTDGSDSAPVDTGVADGPLDAPVDVADARTDAAPSCTSARDAALGPIETVSTGSVGIVTELAGVRTIYVDASAGGSAAAKTNPWIYVDLATGTRVDVHDRAALASSAWHLGLKRPLLRTNSGDGGPGKGGAVFLKGKAFDVVTDAEAKAATTLPEAWFDKDCTLATDATGAIKTRFDGWYDYDSAAMKLSPAAGTWIVLGPDGVTRFKVAIQTYYGNPDGTVGATSARYVLKVAAVK